MRYNCLKYISFGTLAAIIFLLIAATFIEKSDGSDVANSLIYHSPLTIALWAVVAVSGISYLLSKRKSISLPTILLHFSLVIILCGAAVSHFYSMSGKIALTTHQTTSSFTDDNGFSKELPFSISLDSCYVETHAGTSVAKDYVSVVTVCQSGHSASHKISMNKILDCNNFRFYQTSISPGHSTLSVSYDPWGIRITYTGYFLIAFSMIAFFFSPKSIFRSLLKKPLATVIFLIFSFSSFCASASSAPATIPVPLARHLATLPVFWGDRVVPFQTMARDFCLQTYGDVSFQGLTAEQVAAGWLFFYDEWKKTPFIRVKGEKTKSLLNSTSKHLPLVDFYSPNGYKLEEALSSEINDNSLQETDRRVALVTSLCTGTVFKIFPITGADGTTTWHSPAEKISGTNDTDSYIFITSISGRLAREMQTHQWKNADECLNLIKEYQIKNTPDGSLPREYEIKSEFLYNKISNLFLPALILILSGISLSLTFRRKNDRILKIAESSVDLLFFIWLSLLLSLRWVIGKHFPISNGYETMLFMSWTTLLAGILLSCLAKLRERFGLMMPLILIVAGLSLMVAHIGREGSSVGPLMPVLASPLLSVHVMLVMTGYALFAVITLNSLRGCIFRKDRALSASIACNSLIILYPALFLLATGIFTGAIWANQSWGRYWGWDPKETWALVTMLIYIFPIHSGSLKWFRKPLNINIYLSLAILFVLFTYFGVNFLLSGMHSYA